MGFQIIEHPSCEHCGDLDPFELTWEEKDGPDWCVVCAEADPEFSATPEEIKAWEKVALKKQLSYYQKVVKRIKKDLENG